LKVVGEKDHVKLVSITDVFWPNGRTTFEVTWDLSVRKIDDNSCEYTNHVTACAIKPFLAFIEERGISGSHDTDAFRAFLGKEGIKPVIPGKSNRMKRIRHAKKDYKKRNVVEHCFCRLKDFRRIATRYDKLAQNFFSALCFAATLA
jgi:Transposase DDE domain